jgi:hypothetical protein
VLTVSLPRFARHLRMPDRQRSLGAAIYGDWHVLIRETGSDTDALGKLLLRSSARSGRSVPAQRHAVEHPASQIIGVRRFVREEGSNVRSLQVTTAMAAYKSRRRGWDPGPPDGQPESLLLETPLRMRYRYRWIASRKTANTLT